MSESAVEKQECESCGDEMRPYIAVNSITISGGDLDEGVPDCCRQIVLVEDMKIYFASALILEPGDLSWVKKDELADAIVDSCEKAGGDPIVTSDGHLMLDEASALALIGDDGLRRDRFQSMLEYAQAALIGGMH